MGEEAITIETTDGVTLDGRLGRCGKEQGAILCHPHPLYGGSMDNNVVLAARDALEALGITTLRFNFRGVGGSSGSYDHGRGEQRDVEAAYTHLSNVVGRVHVVAYSFGSWVALNTLATGERLSPLTVTLISPPVAFGETSFDDLTIPECPTLIVAGDQDQFGPPEAVDKWLCSQDLRDDFSRVTLAGVDHFYLGGEPELEAAIRAFFR